MIYRIVGLMSGSSLDGLDIVFAEFEASNNNWKYKILAADCYAYDIDWNKRLLNAQNLSAYNYMLLHIDYGKLLAEFVNKFIAENELQHQVQLIASHGHTIFHAPELNMTSQLGDGATIAALTEINVVSDLRNIDVALQGQGAPIVPLGEKLLFPGYDFYMNLGGIANLSFQTEKTFIAFDICAANKVLNMLAEKLNYTFDEDGNLAASGSINEKLLNELNAFDYYKKPYPKSLANSFGTDEIYPLIESYNINVYDALCTYVEHIAVQTLQAIKIIIDAETQAAKSSYKLLLTGGGAFNKFLVNTLQQHLSTQNIEIVIPENTVVKYKEALIMALLGVLRWREENTVLASVTGAKRNSIGGAVWIGQQA